MQYVRDAQAHGVMMSLPGCWRIAMRCSSSEPDTHYPRESAPSCWVASLDELRRNITSIVTPNSPARPRPHRLASASPVVAESFSADTEYRRIDGEVAMWR